MHFPFRPGRTAHCFIVLVAALAACSPTFNWREVPVADSGLVALLPCKPDRASRTMPLGAEAVTVEMAGCEAGGATFAVAHARAADLAQAEAWMNAWRAAAARIPTAGARGAEAAASVARAAARPAPMQLEIRGPDGTPEAAAHMLWFAQVRAGGVSVYQATMLGTPSSPEALKTFVEGLRLP
jgi:hypothetical protein